MKKSVMVVLACMFGFQLVFAGLSFAIGAISYSEDDEAVGWVTGHSTKEKAFAEAKKACQEHGGKACKNIVWFKKCGALVTSKDYWGYGIGNTKAEAEKNAKSACKGSNKKIEASVCE